MGKWFDLSNLHLKILGISGREKNRCAGEENLTRETKA